jgi:hypothetical protein
LAFCKILPGINWGRQTALEIVTWQKHVRAFSMAFILTLHQVLFLILSLRSVIPDCLIQNLMTCKALKCQHGLEPSWIPWTTSLRLKSPMN